MIGGSYRLIETHVDGSRRLPSRPRMINQREHVAGDTAAPRHSSPRNPTPVQCTIEGIHKTARGTLPVGRQKTPLLIVPGTLQHQSRRGPTQEHVPVHGGGKAFERHCQCAIFVARWRAIEIRVEPQVAMGGDT